LVFAGAAKGVSISPAPFRPVYTDPADLRSGSDLSLPDTFSASVPFAGNGLSVGTFDGTQFLVSYSVHADRVKATTMNNIPETATAAAANETTPKANITIADNQFQPGNLTVTRGSTVVWLNNDDSSHTITSGMPNSTSVGTRFDSDYMSPQKTFDHRFTSTGSFEYFDKLNPDVRGVITVVSPSR
jgi:plastocyanin